MKLKLTIVIIVSMFFASQLQAQTEKSTLLLGGGISFQSVGGAEFFTFNPNIGIFLKDNFAMGLQTTIISTEGTSAWSIGPYARHYFGKNEKGKLFGQASLNLGGGEVSTTFGGGLTGGYAIFLNKSVGIEMAASYHRISEFGVFGLGVGFQIYFARKDDK